MPFRVNYAELPEQIGTSVAEKFQDSALGKSSDPTTDVNALELNPNLPASIVQLLKAIAIAVDDIEPIIQNVNVTASSINLNTDTIEAKLGENNSPPPASDTDTASLNARLIRLAQLISSLRTQLPSSIGQTTTTNSLSVAIASNQTAIPASQSGNWDIRNISGSISLPIGAATQATLSAIELKIPPLGQAVSGSSIPVAIASNQTAIPASQSGNWDIRNISGSISLPIGAATFSEQQTQSGSLQLLDDIVHDNNAVFNKASAIAGQFNDSSPATPTEGNVSPLRITQNRGLHVNLRNQSGGEIGTVAVPIQVSLANTGNNATAINAAISSLPAGLATDAVSVSIRDRLNPAITTSVDGSLAGLNSDWTAIDPTTNSAGNSTNIHSVPLLLRWLVKGIQSIFTRLPALSSGRIPVEILDAANQTTLSAVNTKIPTLGQSAMAASVPVAIANNQSAIAVSSATFSTLSEQQIQSTSLGNISNSTYTTNAALSRAIAIAAQMDDTATVTASENGIMPLRITSQRGLHSNLRDNNGAELGVSGNPMQVSLQNISTLSQESTLSTFSAKISGVWSSSRATGTVASAVAKSSSGSIFAVAVHNTNAGDRWFQIFNSASAPSGTPLESHRVPGQGSLFLDLTHFGLAGMPLATGIAWGMSSSPSTFSAATASETFVYLKFI
jgi:hypothetical protein